MDVHECWHEFCDVDFSILLFLEFVDGLTSTFVHEDGGISQHGFMPFRVVFDHDHLFQCLVIFLLVDIVNNNGIVFLNQFCILDALVNLTMTLKHLEYRLLVNFTLVLFKELSEAHHPALPFVTEFVFFLLRDFVRFHA